MHLHKYILLLVCSLCGILAFGQQSGDRWCGYSGSSDWLDWYQRNTGLFDRGGEADTIWHYVPVTIHIVGTDDGSGYYDVGDALLALCNMNSQYAPLHIRYYLKPGDELQYHNNSSWYEHDFNVGGTMINTVIAPIKDRLNIFIVSDPAGNCGYSWKDAVVLKKGCSGPKNTTWAHEAGHHFSLPHTFRGWENFDWNYLQPAPAKVNNVSVEKVDGSNCFNSGDRFCDTEPDYLNDRWQCNGDLRSKSVQYDPDSNAFRSDATLYMSYASDQCNSRFSTEQIAAIRANLETEHSSYLQISAPITGMDITAPVELISPVDSTQPVQYNHIEFKWKPIPNARYYTVEIANDPGFNTRFFYQTVTDTTSLIVTKGAPNNWTVYWRVTAANGWDLCRSAVNAQVGMLHTQNLSATNDLERAAVIQLAPNPVMAGAPAHLNILADQAMEITATICDAAGRICYRQPLRVFPGENALELPTAQLSAGAYMVLLQNEKGATVKRLAVVE